MEMLFIILILLVTARIFSELAQRINVPAMAGEILAGVILGIVFNSFSGSLPDLSELPENEIFTALCRD